MCIFFVFIGKNVVGMNDDNLENIVIYGVLWLYNCEKDNIRLLVVL